MTMTYKLTKHHRGNQYFIKRKSATTYSLHRNVKDGTAFRTLKTAKDFALKAVLVGKYKDWGVRIWYFNKAGKNTKNVGFSRPRRLRRY